MGVNYLEGIGRVMVDILSRYVPGCYDENYENSQV